MRSTRIDVRIVCLTLACAALAIGSSSAFAGDATDATAAEPTGAHAAGAERGKASFYSKHLAGHRTASGERYDPKALTAAHRTLPLGTRVRVVNPKNDRSVVVTVNDRGPVSNSRMLDVSAAAADKLGMKKAGVTAVHTQVLGKGDAARPDEPAVH